MATYRVKPGDNLWSIAESLFGDGRAMKRIMYLNGMTSTVIRPGMTLKLPTIVAGRNDQFRITNAEANRLGFATTDQIAAGVAGAGAGPAQYQPGWKGQVKTTPADQKDYTGFEAPIGDELLKGVVKTAPAKSQPTRLVRPQGNERAAGQLQAQLNANPHYQANERPTSLANRMQPAKPVPQQTPAQIGGPMPENQNFFDRLVNILDQAGYQTRLQVQNALGGAIDTTKDAFQQVRQEIRFPWEGPRPTGAVRSASPLDAQVEATLNQIGETLTPAGKPHGEALSQGYGVYFDLMWSQGTPAEKIPTGVMTYQGFPYTVEDMREMGYRVSSDGYYFELAKKGAEQPLSSYTSGPTSSGYGSGSTNPYTGRPYGSGGGGGGGYPGGGSQSTRMDGFLRGSGSWKGINFG